jgi:uncharacterized oxidoreductase
MDISSRTVLITGGATGIGRALAERFLSSESTIIVCGRREEKLHELQRKHPLVHVRICDLTIESARRELCQWVLREYPALDVLVNNAGIQRRVSLLEEESWEARREEMVINFEAQVHLTTLLVPHLVHQRNPAIINVTSGLAFVPLAVSPIYCATKAAFHSFTLSLRHQLSSTPISVIELIPPSVRTDLGGPGWHQSGVPVDEFADVAIEGFRRGDQEITYGFSQKTSRASREELGEIFRGMNHRSAPLRFSSSSR